MKTYKNKHFIRRDYEGTNVVACKAEKAPNDNWEEMADNIIETMKMNQLWIENGVTYFGWL